MEVQCLCSSSLALQWLVGLVHKHNSVLNYRQFRSAEKLKTEPCFVTPLPGNHQGLVVVADVTWIGKELVCNNFIFSPFAPINQRIWASFILHWRKWTIGILRLENACEIPSVQFFPQKSNAGKLTANRHVKKWNLRVTMGFGGIVIQFPTQSENS